MGRDLILAVVLSVTAAGCSDFPCLSDEGRAHEVGAIDFAYDGPRVRYTYWFEDGLQKVVFDREEVPMPARASVLVHIEGQTSGDLHGAVGWAADIRSDESATARVRSMADARAAAYSAWSASWAAAWVETRSALVVTQIAAQQAVRDALANVADEADEAGDQVDQPPDAFGGLRRQDFFQKLEEEQISLGGVKLQRALRSVGARRPTPSDFGLSVDVHPIWLFVEPGCDACDEASNWLEAEGIEHHTLLVSDPTSAATLRKLSMLAGAEPAVPTLWSGGQLLRGFSAKTYEARLR